MELAARLDGWGKGAWIAAMILGFVVFWPVGLAILAYMIFSGRMNHMHMHHPMTAELRDEWRARREAMRNEVRARREEWRARKREWREEMLQAWHRGPAAPSTGNAAFDEYRAETLRRLEEEQSEFRAFLDGLRKARDRAEFDQFMQSRREGPAERPTIDL
jgi:hypothetical protein